MLIIKVIDGKIEYALKKYKKKNRDTQVLKQLRDRMTYTKKSEYKRNIKNKAIRKNNYEK
jgi:small subunit ribosomal protein S21